MPLRKNERFFNVRKKVAMAAKPGVGVKVLVFGLLRKELFFCGFPKLSNVEHGFSIEVSLRKSTRIIIYKTLSTHSLGFLMFFFTSKR